MLGSSRDIKLARVGTVVNDHYVGTASAVGHLVALGHRRIVHLGRPAGAVAEARRARYEDAMRPRLAVGGSSALA